MGNRLTSFTTDELRALLNAIEETTQNGRLAPFGLHILIPPASGGWVELSRLAAGLRCELQAELRERGE